MAGHLGDSLWKWSCLHLHYLLVSLMRLLVISVNSCLLNAESVGSKLHVTPLQKIGCFFVEVFLTLWGETAWFWSMTLWKWPYKGYLFEKMLLKRSINFLFAFPLQLILATSPCEICVVNCHLELNIDSDTSCADKRGYLPLQTHVQTNFLMHQKQTKFLIHISLVL